MEYKGNKKALKTPDLKGFRIMVPRRGLEPPLSTSTTDNPLIMKYICFANSALCSSDLYQFLDNRIICRRIAKLKLFIVVR